MSRASKILTVLVVVALGLWGCARGPANRAGQTERARALEGRCAKLERDYRTVAAARDQARKQATSLEEDNARLQKELGEQTARAKDRAELARQLRLVRNDRDALRRELGERTNQRDSLQQQVNDTQTERDRAMARHQRLRKGLLELIGQDKDADWAEEHKTPTPTGPAIGGQS
jgi:hypothetical protein